MGPSALLVIVLLTGYVVGLPAFLWALADMKRIPGGVWRHAATRPYPQWRVGMISAYALLGWPAIFAALAWRRGRERSDLLAEWAELSARKRQRQRRRAEAARAAAEPVVVLAEYEQEPTSERGHAGA